MNNRMKNIFLFVLAVFYLWSCEEQVKTIKPSSEFEVIPDTLNLVSLNESGVIRLKQQELTPDDTVSLPTYHYIYQNTVKAFIFVRSQKNWLPGIALSHFGSMIFQNWMATNTKRHEWTTTLTSVPL